MAETLTNQQRQAVYDRGGKLLVSAAAGSGKTKVAKKLLGMSDKFKKLISYTTNENTDEKGNDWYYPLSKDKFFSMMEKGDFFESTMYAGHGYGSKKADVEKIISDGKIVLAAMDICGAMSLKTNFRNVITIYIKREKKDLLHSILRKNSSIEDKVDRIIAIDAENKNAEICDYIVEFNTYDEAVGKLCEILQICKK